MALGTYGDRLAQDICTIFLMLFFTGLRIWFQNSQHGEQNFTKRFSKSETFATACLLLCTLAVIAQCTLAQLDNHRKFNLPPNPEIAEQYEFLPSTVSLDFWQSFLNTVAVWLLKGAYLATFFSLLFTLRKGLKVALHLVAVYYFVGFLASLLVHALYCGPINHNWHISLGDTGVVGCTVISSVTATAILFSLNVTCDLLIAGVSIVIIRLLTVAPKIERMALGLVFSVGVISIGVAVARFGIFVWLYTGPEENLTPGNFGLMELLWRLEVIFGAAAYGLAFARALLRGIVERIRSIASSASFHGSRTSNTSKARTPSTHHTLQKTEEHELETMRSSAEHGDEGVSSI